MQTALSASSGNGLEGWDEAQVWTTQLAQEHAIGEGETEGRRQYRRPFCVDAVLPSLGLQHEALISLTK